MEMGDASAMPPGSEKELCCNPDVAIVRERLSALLKYKSKTPILFSLQPVGNKFRFAIRSLRANNLGIPPRIVARRLCDISVQVAKHLLPEYHHEDPEFLVVRRNLMAMLSKKIQEPVITLGRIENKFLLFIHNVNLEIPSGIVVADSLWGIYIQAAQHLFPDEGLQPALA